MSRRTYSFPGFEYVGTTDTPANTILVIGQLIGITTNAVPAGTKQWVAQEGHWLFDNTESKAIAYTQGAPVYVTATGGIGTITATGTQIGVTTKASAVGEPVEFVLKLGH
jgi:predicted RecA/RadA family phage recombinase